MSGNARVPRRPGPAEDLERYIDEAKRGGQTSINDEHLERLIFSPGGSAIMQSPAAQSPPPDENQGGPNGQPAELDDVFSDALEFIREDLASPRSRARQDDDFEDARSQFSGSPSAVRSPYSVHSPNSRGVHSVDPLSPNTSYAMEKMRNVSLYSPAAVPHHPHGMASPHPMHQHPAQSPHLLHPMHHNAPQSVAMQSVASSPQSMSTGPYHSPHSVMYPSPHSVAGPSSNYASPGSGMGHPVPRSNLNAYHSPPSVDPSYHSLGSTMPNSPYGNPHSVATYNGAPYAQVPSPYRGLIPPPYSANPNLAYCPSQYGGPSTSRQRSALYPQSVPVQSTLYNGNMAPGKNCATNPLFNQNVLPQTPQTTQQQRKPRQPREPKPRQSRKGQKDAAPISDYLVQQQQLAHQMMMSQQRVPVINPLADPPIVRNTLQPPTVIKNECLSDDSQKTFTELTVAGRAKKAAKDPAKATDAASESEKKKEKEKKKKKKKDKKKEKSEEKKEVKPKEVKPKDENPKVEKEELEELPKEFPQLMRGKACKTIDPRKAIFRRVGEKRVRLLPQRKKIPCEEVAKKIIENTTFDKDWSAMTKEEFRQNSVILWKEQLRMALYMKYGTYEEWDDGTIEPPRVLDGMITFPNDPRLELPKGKEMDWWWTRTTPLPPPRSPCPPPRGEPVDKHYSVPDCKQSRAAPPQLCRSHDRTRERFANPNLFGGEYMRIVQHLFHSTTGDPRRVPNYSTRGKQWTPMFADGDEPTGLEIYPEVKGRMWNPKYDYTPVFEQLLELAERPGLRPPAPRTPSPPPEEPNRRRRRNKKSRPGKGHIVWPEGEEPYKEINCIVHMKRPEEDDYADLADWDDGRLVKPPREAPSKEESGSSTGSEESGSESGDSDATIKAEPVAVKEETKEVKEEDEDDEEVKKIMEEKAFTKQKLIEQLEIEIKKKNRRAKNDYEDKYPLMEYKKNNGCVTVPESNGGLCKIWAGEKMRRGFYPLLLDGRSWGKIQYFETDIPMGNPLMLKHYMKGVVIDPNRQQTEEVVTKYRYAPDGALIFSLAEIDRLDREEKTIKLLRQPNSKISIKPREGGYLVLRSDSCVPVFVESYLYNASMGDPLDTIVRVSDGQELIIFDECFFNLLLQQCYEYGADTLSELRKLTTIRISFTKGWGEAYKKYNIAETLVWLELQLGNPLRKLDRAMRQDASFSMSLKNVIESQEKRRDVIIAAKCTKPVSKPISDKLK